MPLSHQGKVQIQWDQLQRRPLQYQLSPREGLYRMPRKGVQSYQNHEAEGELDY